jgi:simple sugar transport system ATP-binding protein
MDVVASQAQLALSLSNVSKTFGATQALDTVSFAVKTGEVHCLAGENGCGKSTLIKIVTGVYQPEGGAQINIFGRQYTHITPTLARSLGIAVIWQDLALFPHMSVAENICVDEMIGVVPKWISTRSMRGRAANILDRLGIDLDVNVSLNTLPIAQRQIVAIARALVGEAKLIFMDEPTASLTQNETESLLEIVRSLSAQGVAIVFVSHRLAEVLDIASRVTVLRDGKLVGVYPSSDMTQTRLGELMTGTTLSYSLSTRQGNKSRSVLETQNLCRANEFHNIDLNIRAGEIVGLIGLIGAGRTELAKALIGLSKLDSGQMLLDQKDYSPRSIRDAIKAGVAYVSEDRLSLGLVQEQSIADNTVISVLDRLLVGFHLLSARKKSSLVSHWINELSVKIGQDTDPVSTLSGGNQQRVVLAKWLATEPKLLILDSPTVGVDVGARAGIFRIIRQLAERELAILLICDEVSEVLYNSDRILHMADGEIKREYIPAQTSAEALDRAIYA